MASPGTTLWEPLVQVTCRLTNQISWVQRLAPSLMPRALEQITLSVASASSSEIKEHEDKNDICFMMFSKADGTMHKKHDLVHASASSQNTLLSTQWLPDPPANAKTLQSPRVQVALGLKEAGPWRPMGPEGTFTQNPQMSPSQSPVFKSCLCCQKSMRPQPRH